MNSLLVRMNELLQTMKNRKPAFSFKSGKLVENRDSLMVEYKNMLKELQWIMDEDWQEKLCPICESWERAGHDENCRLGKLLEQ
jgi:hypothetical protein